MNISHCIGLALGFCMFWTAAPAAAQQRQAETDDSFEAALARYQECQKRLPFRFHTEGRERLAKSRDERALALLIDDYKKPENYPEYSKYTLAHILARNFDRDEFVPQLDALRRSETKPVDMWMQTQLMRIHCDRVDDTEIIKIATESKDALMRAAAILALGDSRKGRYKDVVLRNCVEFPRKAGERAALLGAMSGAFYENKRLVNDPDYREALEAYISLLDAKVGLVHASKIQMARHLQWILNGPALFIDPEPWLELLQRGDVKRPKANETSASPSFCGIQTQGERFCYILDMSDSMCKPILPDAKPSTAPTTGPRPKRKKGFLPTEADLPWHLINTRWDLAREQMRISLLRLTDDKYFSVVWFGTKAETLESCKGMIRATKGNVDKVIAELDSLDMTPADKLTDADRETAPDGKLKGSTNLHAGLQLAFSLSKKGPVDIEDTPYVDDKVLTEGCDTIFLLSDGAPSWDTFTLRDITYDGNKGVKSTEYAGEARSTTHLNYVGPYGRDEWLVEDVKRMNAFRRIQLHCIGLGEANMRLLEQLAKMGNGECLAMGRGSKK
ncbi:MAG: hypothetical protein KDE27_17620 [Planctomycetes bacterium]|nr:hypothetical protein [Planctomycetota bacterium]